MENLCVAGNQVDAMEVNMKCIITSLTNHSIPFSQKWNKIMYVFMSNINSEN